MRYFILATCFVVFCAFIAVVAMSRRTPICPIITDDNPQNCYIGQVESTSENIHIRILCLKHCFESIASSDTRLAIEAANLGKSKGLSIADIGDFHIDRKGEAQPKLVYDVKLDEDGLRDFISKQMKTKAQPGDTVIVFTVGHGSPKGYLQYLGQRADIFKVISAAAEENNQNTIWWEFSCYAAAELPSINSLSPTMQELFAVIASSDATTPSYFGAEGKVMQKLFSAIATHDAAVDPNNDEMITQGELAAYFDKIVPGRGKLIYANSPQHVMFGGMPLAWQIPIMDHSDPNKTFPRDYIPLPHRR